MRRLAVTLVLMVFLVVPVTAAADVPPTVVAACQAEYAQLGAGVGAGGFTALGIFRWANRCGLGDIRDESPFEL